MTENRTCQNHMKVYFNFYIPPPFSPLPVLATRTVIIKLLVAFEYERIKNYFITEFLSGLPRFRLPFKFALTHFSSLHIPLCLSLVDWPKICVHIVNKIFN